MHNSQEITIHQVKAHFFNLKLFNPKNDSEIVKRNFSQEFITFHLARFLEECTHDKPYSLSIIFDARSFDVKISEFYKLLENNKEFLGKYKLTQIKSEEEILAFTFQPQKDLNGFYEALKGFFEDINNAIAPIKNIEFLKKSFEDKNLFYLTDVEIENTLYGGNTAKIEQTQKLYSTNSANSAFLITQASPSKSEAENQSEPRKMKGFGTP